MVSWFNNTNALLVQESSAYYSTKIILLNSHNSSITHTHDISLIINYYVYLLCGQLDYIVTLPKLTLLLLFILHYNFVLIDAVT